MGKEIISNGKADGRSSMGNYDSYKTFGQAFKAAHSSGGPGHTFTYRGKMYTTDCKDGGDYRKKKDDRGSFLHRVSQYGHQINKFVKESTGFHCQDYLTGRGYKWSSDVDKQRVEYHRREIEKQQKKQQKKKK
ncbi:unnamed protein product [Paramecium sonneborni]|uniref:Uncharacterized protein n=1 Tax=Paramecium sonneborni TaxID=65129 RepID=A0A8S1RKL1_9CILI|nr:unnamed protein product [Paramecium sonneborni]